MGRLVGNQTAGAARSSDVAADAAAPGRQTLVDPQQTQGVATAGEPGQQANGVGGPVAAHGSSDRFITAFGPPSAAAPGTAATAVARVQALIARADVAGLTELQPELRRQLPLPEAVQALTVARHWEMERVVEIRARYRARLEMARQGASAASADPTASSGGHHRGAQRSGDRTGAVNDVELEMDAECKPYLDALQHGDPQRRFQHSNEDVEREVFAAIQLHGARRGEDMIGHRADAEAEARRMEHLSDTDEWCGAFAYAQMHEGASFDSVWAVHMQGTGGIVQALHYQGMHNFWMWIDGQWRNMVEYHTARHSPRRYVELTGGRVPPDVQPGDILLVDRGANGTADHIQTVLSFDGENVITIGGNEGQDEAGVHRSRGRSLRDNPPIGSNRDRIHGIGRWSIVDYERHIYFSARGLPVASPTMPTAPPAQVARSGGRPR